jgi:hypothetical protein
LRHPRARVLSTNSSMTPIEFRIQAIIRRRSTYTTSSHSNGIAETDPASDALITQHTLNQIKARPRLFRPFIIIGIEYTITQLTNPTSHYIAITVFYLENALLVHIHPKTITLYPTNTCVAHGVLGHLHLSGDRCLRLV